MPRDLSHVPPLADRPKCKGCGQRLRPLSHNNYEQIERKKTPDEMESERRSLGRHSPVDDVAISQKFVGRSFYDWQGYDGFHSLRCALAFAIAAHNAGFRRTK